MPVLSTLALSLATLSAVSATAIPSTQSKARAVDPSLLTPKPSFTCGEDQLYVVNKNGKIKHWEVPTLFGENLGCVNKTEAQLAHDARRLAARQDNQYETFVELNDDTVVAADACLQQPDQVSTFGDLWDQIIGAACGQLNSECRGSVTIDNYHCDQIGGSMQMAVEGAWPIESGTELRDQLFELAREAFFKAVEQRREPTIIYEDGPSLMRLDAGQRQNGELRIEFNDQVGTDRSCPDVVNIINSFGALAPQLAPVFGVSGAVCAVLG